MRSNSHSSERAPTPACRRRFRYTKIGVGLGVVAVATWMATFDPHGGVELSSIHAPLWHCVLHLAVPGQSIPTLAWYAGLMLHWPLLGAAVDLLRAGRQTRRSTAATDHA
jgi:hypothetical protein